MIGIAESVVESAALSWLRELGFTTVHEADIAPGELGEAKNKK